MMDKRRKTLRVADIKNCLLLINDKEISIRENILINKILELEDKLVALQQSYIEVLTKTKNLTCVQDQF